MIKPHITGYCKIDANGITLSGKHLPDGCVDFDSLAAKIYEGLPEKYARYGRMDRMAKLGYLTAELLMNSIDIEINDPYRKSIILQNSSASLDTDIAYRKSMDAIPSPSLFVYTLPNVVNAEICIRHGIKGVNHFFVSDRFDAGFISKYVNLLFASDKTDFCLCGYVDLLGADFKSIIVAASDKGDAELTEDMLEKIFKDY